VNESLWRQALKQSNIAIKYNSLKPIHTNLDFIEEDKINYEIRSLTNYTKFPKGEYGPKVNPFRPWDPLLEITPIIDKHILILNKYPIEIGHMLLITKNWNPQNGWLTKGDWNALLEVNSDTSGLWFFNSSYSSGASQPHRHIQLLPRKLDQINCPRDQWFKSRIDSKKCKTDIERCTVVYGIESKSKDDLINELDYLYKSGCAQLGIGDCINYNFPQKPYNLLFTNNYFAIILRSREYYKGFSINALGFAGYLLATNKSDLDWLRSSSIENLLNGVIIN
tara:strand:- start:1512 stop:2351 length:840 start_codon:yes stop_codon:yes gene_type:complete